MKIDAPPTPPPASRFGAILRQLCPRCRRGRVFAAWLTMNERCPACGLRFEREPGYFLGAMYVSYLLGIPLLLGVTLGVKLLWLRSWELHWALFPAMLFFAPLVPAIFRYSRVVWMHFDRTLNPGPPPSAP